MIGVLKLSKVCDRSRIFLSLIDMLNFGLWKVWNQCLVNHDFDDNKTRLKTNDHISSVIRQDNGNPKTNQANEKSWRRRPPQREEFFKTKAS